MSERHERDADVTQGRRPSDTEELIGETAASRPLTESERVQPAEAASRDRGGAGRGGQTDGGSDDAEAELGHS